MYLLYLSVCQGFSQKCSSKYRCFVPTACVNKQLLCGNYAAVFLFVSLFIPTSNFPLVPGGNDGPSGVLVSSENYLTYKNFGDQQDVRCPIPRRKVNKFSLPVCFMFVFPRSTSYYREWTWFYIDAQIEISTDAISLVLIHPNFYLLIHSSYSARAGKKLWIENDLW